MLLRILTMNVQNDEGDARRQKILNAGLRRIAPDLVSFQEVGSGPGRSQLDGLLEGTGLHGTHQAGVLAYDMPFSSFLQLLAGHVTPPEVLSLYGGPVPATASRQPE